ncbi:MAG: VOC family protein [Hyphomicrobiales bacterium]
MKIDHVFICVESPIKNAKILADFGITEGEPNIHTGQGTANHRFFFDNAYFQLLHVTSEELLQSKPTKPSSLLERFHRVDNSISPFGICLYPGHKKLNITDYETIEYQPKFIHPPLKMHIFETPLIEPMYYFLDYISDSSKETHTTYRHEIGFQNITGVKIRMPASGSSIKQALTETKTVEFIEANEHLLELEFDDGLQGKNHDFRPELPLIFRW